MLPDGFEGLSNYLPFDLFHEIKNSKFTKISSKPLHEFENEYIKMLLSFKCHDTGIVITS